MKFKNKTHTQIICDKNIVCMYIKGDTFSYSKPNVFRSD